MASEWIYIDYEYEYILSIYVRISKYIAVTKGKISVLYQKVIYCTNVFTCLLIVAF